MKKILLALVLILPAVLTACVNSVANEEQMTVAKAQKEIKIGMSSAEVIEVMGAPNMVTTDDKRRETWVYDKVSTNVSGGQTGVWFLVGTAGGYNQSKNQRTLTIIVKFDENNMVRDFAYRTSTF